MARHRMVAPINSRKHFVPQSLATIVNGAISNAVAVKTVSDVTGITNTFDVIEGAQIKAIHVELWYTGGGATGTAGQFVLTVEKVPAGATKMTAAQAVNLNAYPNKKNILFTSQGIIGATIDGQSSVPIIRSWVLIPRGKQRMGLGDEIIVNTAAVGQDIERCGIFIYKEYK